MRYRERGELTFGAYRGEAGQAYWFAVGQASGTAEVRFDDGRLFHTLDLRSGLADVAHECAPDRYRGRYRTISRDSWTLVWKVEGARKQMLIGTRFVRI